MNLTTTRRGALIATVTLFLVIGGFGVAALVISTAPDDAHEFFGVYRQQFETAEFTPCAKEPFERAWLVADDPEFFTRFNRIAERAGKDGLRESFSVSVRFEGGAKRGNAMGYGHLGGYPAEVKVTKLLVMEATPDGKCVLSR